MPEVSTRERKQGFIRTPCPVFRLCQARNPSRFSALPARDKAYTQIYSETQLFDTILPLTTKPAVLPGSAGEFLVQNELQPGLYSDIALLYHMHVCFLLGFEVMIAGKTRGKQA